MKIEDILALEKDNANEIHLVRDRLFWQAWERSAFLFSKQVRPYKVHHRHYQKVGQDLVWLGFPKTALASLEASIIESGAVLEWFGEDHGIIRGVVALDGFDVWKQGVIGQAGTGLPESRSLQRTDPTLVERREDDRWLPAYRHAYDLALHVSRACSRMGKEYKYGLGEQLRNSTMELVESLHPGKIALQPATHGFPFLGAYILPHRTYIGRRTKANFRAAMERWGEYDRALAQAGSPWPKSASRRFRSIRDSYAGLLGHFQCRRLLAHHGCEEVCTG